MSTCNWTSQPLDYSPLMQRLRASSQVASAIVFWMGCIVILGWMFDITLLKSVLPGLVTMKANTAIAFILAGGCLWLLCQKSLTPFQKCLAQGLSVTVALLGFLTLVQYVSGWNLHIDQLIFQEPPTAVATSTPGRMSPNTAFNFLLLGSALWFLSRKPLHSLPIQCFTLVAGLIALLGLIGYAYGIQSFYGIGSYTKMAVHTAVAFCVLCGGILSFHPDRGVIAILTNPHAGGIMARRLIWAIFAIPPCLGGVILAGYRAKLYDSEVAMSLLVVGSMVIFAALIGSNAHALGHLDSQRLQAEERSRIDAIAAAQAEQLRQTLQELQATQSQLIQSEKMSSLGQLVAGVAHEINNPVNFIYGNLSHTAEYTQDLLYLLELYQQTYPQPTAEIQDHTQTIDLEFLVEDLPKMLSSMKVGAERIRQIVLTLRNFSRLDEAAMKPVDIHEGVDSTLLILQNRLKVKPEHPAIQIVKQYDTLPLVECYAGQLNQVFMNLVSNAIDALDSYNSQRSYAEIEANPSVITIRSQRLSPTTVGICIADNGPGIPPEVKERIFDPFFTTKPVGKGTGLGLSISYQIVTEKHQGSFWCESVPGKGTEFWIELPITQEEQPQLPAQQVA